MNISYIVMNRLLEKAASVDETTRNELIRNGKVTLANGRVLSDAALLAKLASLGLPMDRDEFLRRTRFYLSAQQMAEAVYDDPPEKLGNRDRDWVWIAFTCLWERWSPQRPSFEMIDDRMQEGYQALERDDQPEACRLWLETWKSIWAIVQHQDLRSIEAFDDLFGGTNSVFNWLQDFLMELYNAGLREKAFYQERLAVLEALLGGLDLGGLLPAFKNDLAETCFLLGMTERAEQLYRVWLAETPRWGWGWIGWANIYDFAIGDPARNPARAEQILTQGLAIPGVEDRSDILDRLHTLDKTTGRAEEAMAVLKETEHHAPKSAPPLPAPAAQVPPRTVSAPGKERGLPAGGPAARVPPAPARRVGRNDPCPCGKGKKFKMCCGRR